MSTTPTAEATSDTEGLDPNSLAAIRNLLASEPQVIPDPVEERAAAQEQVAQASSVAAPQTSETAPTPAKARKAKRIKPPRAPRAKREIPLIGEHIERIKARVLAYRPTPKHIILAAIALLVIFRPWLVLGMLFLMLFVVVGIFLILGYDGFWRRAMGLGRWYARRRPERSAELHRKLDNFAMRFDAFLDRFPEGSVDGLYLPDFGDLATAEARHDEALDRRFESLREGGA